MLILYEICTLMCNRVNIVIFNGKTIKMPLPERQGRESDKWLNIRFSLLQSFHHPEHNLVDHCFVIGMFVFQPICQRF